MTANVPYTFLSSRTENSDRFTWALTSTRSTRLWLRPLERQSTEVWPTGRESTSQRKSITQVPMTTLMLTTSSVRLFCLFFCPLKSFYCQVFVSNSWICWCAGLLSAMDLVEVNPMLGASREAVEATASLAVDVIASSLGQTREGAHPSIDVIPAVKDDTEQLRL